MEIQEISTKLVELLREGKFEDVYDQLFEVEKVKHIEPQSPHFPEIIGVSAIKEKDKAMGEAIEQVNSLEVGNPIIAKNHFAISYQISISLKNGETMELDEIIIYEVQDGKIVLEQFFY